MPTLAGKSAAKRTLRIVSKCSTRAEFVAVFRRLCDDTSIFIATNAPKDEGTEVRFNITLADNTSMLAGSGRVSASHPTNENEWKRPGMRIEFIGLDAGSQNTLTLLTTVASPPPLPKKKDNGAPTESAKGSRTKRVTDLPPPVRGSAPSLLPKKPILIPSHIPPVKQVDSGWGGDDEDEAEDTQITDAPVAPISPEALAPAPATEPAKEERAKGSDYILPANPFGELAPEMLEAFIECTLYEETGSIDIAQENESEGGKPFWWNKSGEMPAVDLSPETAPQEHDDPDTDLRTMAQSAKGTAFPPNRTPPPIADASSIGTAATMAMTPIAAALEPSAPTQVTAVPEPPANVPTSKAPSPWAQTEASMPTGSQPAPGPWAQAAAAQQAQATPGPMPTERPMEPRLPANAGSAAPLPNLGAHPPHALGSVAPFIPPQRAPTPTDLVMLRSNRRRTGVIVAVAVAATLVFGYVLWGRGGSEDEIADNSGPSGETEASAKGDEAGRSPGSKAAAAKVDGPSKPTESGGDDDPATAAQGPDTRAEPDAGSDAGKPGTDAAPDDPETAASIDDGKTSDGKTGDEKTEVAGGEPGTTTDPVAESTTVQSGTCAAKLSSRPRGASVYLGKRKLGVTPATVEIPCQPAKLLFKSSRYQSKSVSIKPAAGEETPASIRLERPMFSLRVTSLPRATVFVGGRRVGSTPRTTKVRGFERTTVKLVRKGYKTWTKKVYVKKKRESLRIRLKRKR